MENLSWYVPWCLGTLAAALHAAGYITYNVQSKKGESKPKVLSWSVWAFMAILNLWSFSEVTDLPHALQYVVGSFGASITFVIAIWAKRFERLKPREWVAFGFCVASVSVLIFFKDAAWANALVLVPFLISTRPTVKGVWDNPFNEKPLAWWVWTAAFAVNLLNNALSWNGEVISVVNPIVLLLCHAIIAYLAREARRQRVAFDYRP